MSAGYTVRGEHRCYGGVQGFYEHPSASVGGTMRFAVYLPPAALKGERVPAVYFLAGLTCTEETFAAKAGAQRVAAELGLALVTCDTSPRHARHPGDDASWDFGQGAGFYVDATEAPWSGSYRMYSYVTRDLRAVVGDGFPIDPERRGVMGHSMGGHGALVMALREAGAWQSVSALAPIVGPSAVPWGEKAFTGYLGSNREAWRSYDAVELVKRASVFPGEVLIDQGTTDRFLEVQLQPERFAEACAAAGQRLSLRMRDGYDHSYYFIETFIEEHLRHHAKALLG
ncbi:MAG: S-formylglutathione hydrolase [Myxococcaceae bacterium]|nr:MAG: S-formylglutathione hydrolase [Myxococcaceae bacterium]